MVRFVFLHWVDLLNLDEVCRDIAIRKVWLLEEDYLLSVDDADHADVGSLSPEDLNWKGLASLEGKQAFRLKIFPQGSNTLKLYRFLHDLHNKSRHHSYDIQQAHLGRPIRHDIPQVVVEGIDTELHRILVQEVNSWCLCGVTISHGYFEL